MADLNQMDACTHNCSTCGGGCSDIPEGERKPSIFERMEHIAERAEEIGEDNIIEMLNNFVDSIEQEDQ